MPAPAIFATTTVPPARQLRAFTFTPYAFPAPNAWVSSALPAGLTMSATTGVISGTPTAIGDTSVSLRAGVTVSLTAVSLTAGNTVVGCASTAGLQVGQTVTGTGMVDGTLVAAVLSATTLAISNAALASGTGLALTAAWWSEATPFTLSVSPGWPTPALGFTAVTLDYLTRTVTFDGVTGVPVFKSGDELLQQLRVMSDGVTQDLNVSALKCSLKFGERDAPLVTGSSFAKVGSGTATVYLHATTLASSALTSALNFAALGLAKIARKNLATAEVPARSVRMRALAEFEIVFANTSGTGANPTRWTSLTVPVQIERELTVN